MSERNEPKKNFFSAPGMGTSATGFAVKKITTVESTTLLGNAGVFTGAWHDTNIDGTIFVSASEVSAQPSATNGFTVEETDDTTNASFTHGVGIMTAPAATLNRLHFCVIKARFWRVRYTNGATPQTTFELTTTACNSILELNATDIGVAANVVGPLFPIVLPGSFGAITDNNTSSSVVSFTNTAGSGGAPLITYSPAWGGAFSGTPDTARQGWSRRRTATVFRSVTTAATGSTAIWTAAANNKWRLLAFRVQVTALAKAAVGADLIIKILDVAADLQLTSVCTIPAAAAGNGVIMDTGWITLGDFGILAAAVATALNVNLSFALTGGLVCVTTAGVEE